MKRNNPLSFSRISCLSLNRQRYREALLDCYMSVFTCLLSWLAAPQATVIWTWCSFGALLHLVELSLNVPLRLCKSVFPGKSSFLHVSTQNTVSVCDTAGDFSTHCWVYHTLHQCCFSELFRSAVTISNWKWILRSEPDSQCQSADSKARIQEHARQGEGDNGLNNPLEGKGSIWRRARAWRMRCLCGSGYWDREFRDHSRTQKGRTTTDAYLETHEEM